MYFYTIKITKHRFGVSKDFLMKKTVFLLVFIMAIVVVKAQYKPYNLPKYDYKHWHFGFTLGLNNMNLSVHPITYTEFNKKLLIIEPSASQGFNIGIVANKRLGEFLDLRCVPTLSFGERQIKYLFIEGDTTHVTYVKKVESTYLDIPFTLKYKSKRLPGNLGNVRVYVLAGARYSYDFASQKNKNLNNTNIVIKLAPQDVLGTVGMGFDFYFQFFKFGLEFQTALGSMNLLVKEDNQFALNVDKIYNRISWITLTFE